MNEEESRKAIFALNSDYMSHNAKERKKLYASYVEERNKIKAALARAFVKEKLEQEEQQKTL